MANAANLSTASRKGRTRALAARIVAVTGTVLVGLPLAAPIALALLFLIVAQGFRLDYLMPGELFPVVVAGGAALLAAALAAARLRVAVGVALGAVLLCFLLVGVFATVTGLASGETAAEGWPLALVAGTYALYLAAVIALFVIGVLLCRAVFAKGFAPLAAPAAQVR